MTLPLNSLRFYPPPKQDSVGLTHILLLFWFQTVRGGRYCVVRTGYLRHRNPRRVRQRPQVPVLDIRQHRQLPLIQSDWPAIHQPVVTLFQTNKLLVVLHCASRLCTVKGISDCMICRQLFVMCIYEIYLLLMMH